MAEMASPDRYILSVEKVVFGSSERRFEEGDTFCLSALLNANPTNPDSAYGKKLFMYRLLDEEGKTLHCSVDDARFLFQKLT